MEKKKFPIYLICYLRIVFILIAIMHATGSFACACKSLPPLTQDLTKKYELIFCGKIDSVSACGDKGWAIAYFTISDLYKGVIDEKIAIHFDCSSSCMMSFSENEEWLIYANYLEFDQASVIFCSPSRKYFQKVEDDFYMIETHRSYEEEKNFLKTTLGIQPFSQKEKWNEEQAELKPHNEQPSDRNKIYLLLVSFGIMMLIVIVTRKKKKKNGE